MQKDRVDVKLGYNTPFGYAIGKEGPSVTKPYESVAEYYTDIYARTQRGVDIRQGRYKYDELPMDLLGEDYVAHRDDLKHEDKLWYNVEQAEGQLDALNELEDYDGSKSDFGYMNGNKVSWEQERQNALQLWREQVVRTHAHNADRDERFVEHPQAVAHRRLRANQRRRDFVDRERPPPLQEGILGVFGVRARRELAEADDQYRSMQRDHSAKFGARDGNFSDDDLGEDHF